MTQKSDVGDTRGHGQFDISALENAIKTTEDGIKVSVTCCHHVGLDYVFHDTDPQQIPLYTITTEASHYFVSTYLNKKQI